MSQEIPADHPLAEELRRLVLAVQASGRAILPVAHDELLQTVVEAAARIFGAAAASIALVDEKNQTLVFHVAYGAGRDEVVGMSIPINQGIAGYVAMTGQPMAISNVQQDTRFARAAAEKTGYVPRSILAMPLLYNDRVIGVIEVLDKINAPSFGMQDMELLALFARQAAMAIHSSQQYEQLDQALLSGLKELVGVESEMAQVLRAPPDDLAAKNDVLALADAFSSISQLGDAERKMCLQVLQTFADYVRAKPRYA